MSVDISLFPDCEFRSCVHLYARWTPEVLVYLLPVEDSGVWQTQVDYEVWRTYEEERELLATCELNAWDAWLTARERTWARLAVYLVVGACGRVAACVARIIRRLPSVLKLVRRLGKRWKL